MALLRRCLTDTSMPLDTRAAGALILLFGQSLSRVRHLTVDQLDLYGATPVLRIGRRPLLLHPRMATLLAQLAERPYTRAQLAAERASSIWLFPGLNPGRPIGVKSLEKKLHTYQINARAGRNTALITLAAELPAAVLTDAFGVTPDTAVDWAARARRDWATYIAHRRPG